MSLEIKSEEPDNSEIEKNDGNDKPVRFQRARKSEPIYNFDDDESASNGENSDNESLINKDRLTGYVLYCQDNRDDVLNEFGDLTPSTLNMKLGKMWAALPAGIKRSYSCRARQMKKGFTPSKKARVAKKPEGHVDTEDTQQLSIAFLCEWDTCSLQFEAVDECAQHISEQHLQPLCTSDSGKLISPVCCRWRGCVRRRRCSTPFVVFNRLSRHMAEEHVLVGKRLGVHEQNEHYIPRQCN